MLDHSVVGSEQPVRSVDIERGRLEAFARAIGEDDPIYSDVAAARAAGHDDLPVPPTFLFGLNLGRGADQDMAWMRDIGIDPRYILHGDQTFIYHDVAHAGDTLVLQPRITDMYEKKGGALQFVVRETTVRRADGSAVADMRETVVVRMPPEES